MERLDGDDSWDSTTTRQVTYDQRGRIDTDILEEDTRITTITYTYMRDSKTVTTTVDDGPDGVIDSTTVETVAIS